MWSNERQTEKPIWNDHLIPITHDKGGAKKKRSKEKEMCSCVRKRSSIEYDDRLTFTSIIYRSKDYAYVWRRHHKVNCIGHFILNLKSDHRFSCWRKLFSLSLSVAFALFLSLWRQQLLLICVKNIAQLKWNLALTYGTKRWHSLHCLFRTIAHTQSSLRFDEDCLKAERQPPWFVKVSALESRCNAYGNRNPYARCKVHRNDFDIYYFHCAHKQQ